KTRHTGGYRDWSSDVCSSDLFTRSLLRLLERERPDVVWATGLKAAYMAAPACRIGRVPIVWHKVDFSLDAVLTRPLAVAVNGVRSEERRCRERRAVACGEGVV